MQEKLEKYFSGKAKDFFTYTFSHMKVKVPSVENSKGRRVFLSVLSVSGIRHIFELKFSHSQLISRHSIKVCIRNIRVYPTNLVQNQLPIKNLQHYKRFELRQISDWKTVLDAKRLELGTIFSLLGLGHSFVDRKLWFQNLSQFQKW